MVSKTVVVAVPFLDDARDALGLLSTYVSTRHVYPWVACKSKLSKHQLSVLVSGLPHRAEREREIERDAWVARVYSSMVL